MSWIFRSRNTRSPRATTSRTIDGPLAMNACKPDLEHADDAVQRVDEAEDLVARGEIDGDDETVVRLHDGMMSATVAMRQFCAQTADMDKFTIARTLDEISRYIELSDPQPFRARAFEKAARAVENLDDDIDALVEVRRALRASPASARPPAQVIEEIVRTGASQYLEELRAQYPPGIFELLRVPKLGLKKIGQLHAELGIGSLDELEEAAQQRAAREAERLRREDRRADPRRASSSRACASRSSSCRSDIEVGEMLRERLADIDEIEDAEVSGSVRRRLEVIRNVNIVIATKKPAGRRGEARRSSSPISSRSTTTRTKASRATRSTCSFTSPRPPSSARRCCARPAARSSSRRSARSRKRERSRTRSRKPASRSSSRSAARPRTI